MEFTPIPSTVGGLLQSEKFYSIPKYQRDYVWSDHKIKELWNDISFCLIKNDDITYFLGSFIVKKAVNDKEDIIDGQQRLTSILILLGIICKEFIKLKDNFNIKFTKKYCVLGDLVSQTERSRLLNEDHLIFEIILSYSVDETINAPLEDYLKSLGQKATKKEEQFINCYNIYYDCIQKLINTKTPKEQSNLLEKIRDIILKISIIRIQVENAQSASLVFETINARGQTLEIHDLIKNYLFMYEIPVGGRNLFESKWEKIISIIESSKDPSVTRFCSHYCTAFFGKKAKGDIYEAYKENTPRDKVSDRINSLESVAEIYKHIVDGNDNISRHKELNHYLSCLNKLGVSILRPVLIALLLAYKNSKIDYKTLCKELKKITAFFSIYVGVCSIKTNTLQELIYSTAKQLNNTFSVAALQTFVTALIAKKPSISDFTNAFVHLAFSNHKELYPNVIINKGKVQYILNELELFVQSNEDFTIANFSIEHVKDDEDGGNACYIGNFVPLPPRKNSNLVGKSFVDKLTKYAESCFKSTQNFSKIYSKYTTWEDKDIMERGELMAKKFYESIWAI